MYLSEKVLVIRNNFNVSLFLEGFLLFLHQPSSPITCSLGTVTVMEPPYHLKASNCVFLFISPCLLSISYSNLTGMINQCFCCVFCLEKNNSFPSVQPCICVFDILFSVTTELMKWVPIGNQARKVENYLYFKCEHGRGNPAYHSARIHRNVRSCFLYCM